MRRVLQICHPAEHVGSAVDAQRDHGGCGFYPGYLSLSVVGVALVVRQPALHPCGHHFVILPQAVREYMAKRQCMGADLVQQWTRFAHGAIARGTEQHHEYGGKTQTEFSYCRSPRNDAVRPTSCFGHHVYYGPPDAAPVS